MRTPVSRNRFLGLSCLHTNKVASFVELWLSHGERTHLSHALEMAILRECKDLGLSEKNVVISNGPANNFLTIGSDIRPSIFSPLGGLAPQLPPELTGDSFAFFRCRA